MALTGAAQPRLGSRAESRFGWALAGLGVAALFAAVAARPAEAQAAASQVWTPFVLVVGLLLIGLVADDDRLFAFVGHQLAQTARTGAVIFVGAVTIVGLVTALLNLDTAVAFLTPVLVYTARSRGEGEAPLLYGSLLLANAGSLFLPGSNLTNLIVLGHLHLTGGQFFARMWAPGLAALLVTGTVVAVFGRKALRVRREDLGPVERPVLGLGVLAVVAAALLVVLLRSPALPVAAIGLFAVGARIATGGSDPVTRSGAWACRCWSALRRRGRVGHGRTGLDRTGQPALAPRYVGNCGGRRAGGGVDQQPSGGLPPRGAPATAPLRLAHRPEHRAQSVRVGIIGLVPLAPCGTGRGCAAVVGQGQSHGGRRGPPLAGRGRRTLDRSRNLTQTA